MRFIKAHFPADKSDAVIEVIEQCKPIDWAMDKGYGRNEKAVEITVDKGNGQKLIDELQRVLYRSKNWRVTVLPVEATLPRPKDETPKENGEKAKTTALREELYQKVAGDCKLNTDFIVLTILSAIVAAIGLNYNNVAIVIAAMVIAPLLGPILAFALAVALGDLSLMKKSAKTGLSGLMVGFGFALLIGVFLNVNMQSGELLSRADIGPEVIVLALASGAAAALSLSTGISSALVGVMVAVALLPPSVASALFLGQGKFELALAAALLTAINVVSAVLSAQLVFVWKGVRPRTYYSQKKAAKAIKINAAFWITLLLALAALSYWGVTSGLLSPKTT